MTGRGAVSLISWGSICLVNRGAIDSVFPSSDEPYTAWVRDDDMEDWNRKPDEIYTNIVLDKGAKQLLVIDRLTYGDRDLAIIHIIQTETQKFRRMGLPMWSGTWTDVTDPTCLEPVSNWIEGHRKVALGNYIRGLRRDAKQDRL